VSCNGGVNTTVILSRADDEGSQVAASVDFEILPLRYAQRQDDALWRFHFNCYKALVLLFLDRVGQLVESSRTRGRSDRLRVAARRQFRFENRRLGFR
jgi:hypothetical protein